MEELVLLDLGAGGACDGDACVGVVLGGAAYELGGGFVVTTCAAVRCVMETLVRAITATFKVPAPP